MTNQKLSSFEKLPSPQGETVVNMAFEQYKLLVDSINKINETRESSNNFWVGANGVGISALAYLRDAQSIQQHHKPILFATLIIIGIFFCLSWLSYLWTIKKSIQIRSILLVDLEKEFPVPIFSRIFSCSPVEEATKPVLVVLTLKEMLVPSIFLMSYLFFAVLLYFFPFEAIAGTS